MLRVNSLRDALKENWPVYAVVIVGTLLSIMGCLALWRWELDVAQARFEAAAGNRAAAVRREINADIAMLLSLRSWRAESLEHLSELIVNALTERSTSGPSGGAAYVWFPRPGSGAKAGLTSRSVLVTGDWREFHSMDLDPWTHPLIAGAVRASCATGRLAATPPIRINPSLPAEVWLVAAMPGASAKDGVGCPGFVAAVERVDLLTERALQHLVPAGVDVEISDATEISAPISMYLHRSRLSAQETQSGQAANALKMANHAQMLRVGGRNWLIANRPRRSLASGYWQPWLALAAGLGMTALAALAVGLALFQARHVRRIVRLRTAELMRANQELARAHEKIVESDRVKSEFLANISHEIRTPLSGVVGMIDLTLDEPEESARREQMHAVRDSAQTLLALVNQLLDFSKVESSGLTVEAAWFDLFATVDASLRTLAIAAGKKGLTLKFTWHASMPREAFGDALRLQQVLLNLIGNAIKFTDAGEVEVEVEPGPKSLRIRVRDTGMGIPSHMLKKIFEPFRQADGSAKRAHGGAGLGLSIAARLIGLMNGTITVDSVEGAGSTFTVELPQPHPWSVEASEGGDSRLLHQQVIIASQPAPPLSPAGAFSLLPPIASHPQEGCDILLVEDNLINQRLALRLLQRGGHRVTLSEDGTQAVAVCRRARFDLILMDIQMPGMDGLEATRRIKADPAGANRSTPIVALSAHASRHDARECLAAGMCDLVTKPFTAEELEHAIRRFTVQPNPTLTALRS